MYELMFDLETLDTKPSAVVLSVGVVIWETVFNPQIDGLRYDIAERFLRVLDIQEQLNRGRTVSQSTLLWWQQQDPTARAEAFNPERESVSVVLHDLRRLVDQYFNKGSGYKGIKASGYKGINRFWASPSTFDFPIWDDLAMAFHAQTPWKYNQKYDVRTVVQEANLSAKNHFDGALTGIAHTPVYDCEWQISLLNAARNKAARRAERSG